RGLEEDLGVALFLRDNRSVSLTHEGKLFQAYARETLGDWKQIRQQLLAESETLAGEIRIYCSVTASYSFLYELLSEFRLRHPRIEIKLHTGDPASAIARVQRGAEDVAISARPDTLPPGLAFRSMTISPLVFIAPDDGTDWRHLEGSRQAAGKSEHWARVPVILSEQDLARQRVDDWFRALKVQPQVYAQVSGNEAIVSMVGLGFGVGVVPKIVLDNSPLGSRVRVLNVRPKLAPYDVGLCALERRLKDPIIRALWSQLR
ncbi:MAG: HTH-type transcriptional activator IlvY, partial [Gammaproteobacteria bacterium]